MTPSTQGTKPPYVRFQILALEDKSKVLENGRYGFKNHEMAYITRPGQKDTVVKEAELWLGDLERMAREDRIPLEWVDHFRKQFAMWKEGQEPVEDGTPVRGWPVILPAQAEELVMVGVRTVEALAESNMEVLGQIGIGALELQKKARNWLAAATDTGRFVGKMEVLERENAAARDRIAALEQRLAEVAAGEKLGV